MSEQYTPVRMRLGGESAVVVRHGNYQAEELDVSEVLSLNQTRFNAAKKMAGHIIGLETAEEVQSKTLVEAQRDTDVTLPDDDSPEYGQFMSKYNKGLMTDDEKRVRNARIDLGQAKLALELASVRAQGNNEDDQDFAAAHLDVLREQAAAEAGKKVNPMMTNEQAEMLQKRFTSDTI